MAKIYPDTNRFVDFYQTGEDNIALLDQLQRYKAHLVITEQTVTEFRRNRVSTLKRVRTELAKSLKFRDPHTTSILRTLPAHKDITELLSKLQKKSREALEQLKQFIADEKGDPVLKHVLALASDNAVTRLSLNERAITAASRRKLLGNPPSSPDKYSAGDEVIWELLLAGLNEDLIIVTKDHTFLNNISLLREEYERATGKKLLLVTEKLSSALEQIELVPPPELIEAEKKEQESLPPLGWIESNWGDAADSVMRAHRSRRLRLSH